MNQARFRQITGRYPTLTLAVVGDLCLDRYLEIDPRRQESSIETGLPVHNVTRVRAQPGAAGTILNNLAALGVGRLFPVGFCGIDGEGFELRRALSALPGVCLEHFFEVAERRTFTYCKPLLVEPGRGPVELNRLDSKNWSPTPPAVEQQIRNAIRTLAPIADGMIALDQVDIPETGVVTAGVRKTLGQALPGRPPGWILADSRRGLADFPPVAFKMNRAEMARLTGIAGTPGLEAVKQAALTLARRNRQPVFVTLAEEGIVGADADGRLEHRPALPVRGEIDIVGAGDAVTASLAAALAAGAALGEALELANAAASIVLHQLGTTGTASVAQLETLLAGTND